MTRSPLVRWGVGALATVAVLGVLRARPWLRSSPAGSTSGAREQLAVGFLPVT